MTENKNDKVVETTEMTEEEFEARAERFAGEAPRLVENAVKVIHNADGTRSFVKNDSPAAQ